MILCRVCWDGRILDELSAVMLPAEDRHKAALAVGSYGFFNQQGMTKFQGTNLHVGN